MRDQDIERIFLFVFGMIVNQILCALLGEYGAFSAIVFLILFLAIHIMLPPYRKG